MSNYITIKLRRGTAAQWTATNPVLAEGEFGAETDTRKFKIGNGSTAWNSLQYWGGSGGGAADFIDLGDVPASYAGSAGKFVKVNATADGLEFGTLTIAAGDLPSGIDATKIANGNVSNTEFQYLDGVTSSIQTQLDGKAPLVHTHVASDIVNIGHLKLIGRHGAGTGAGQEIGIDGGLEFQGANIRRSALTGDVTASAGDNATTIANGAVTNAKVGSGIDAVKLADGSVSNTEFQYLNGVTSAIQTQLDGKVDENTAISPATKTKISYDAKGLVTAGADAAIADITGLQTALDSKVDENAAITPGTKTKITYDAKGLVTAGADATTADIADSNDKRYVTEAEKTKLSNLSGTNTGDQNLFSTIAVSGQSNVVADTTGDTLTLVAGSNVTITTDAATDSITISSTGGGGGGISDGDKGDITVSASGATWTIDNDAVTYAKIQNVSAASRILGRKTSGAGDTEELTASEVLDFIGSTRGSILYAGASGWAALTPGTSGQVLQTNGSGADPSWAAAGGGGGATNLWVAASQMIPRTSNSTGIDSRELATNDTNFDELLFDAGADEFAQFLVIMPNNYANGTVTARFYWTASTGSGDVVWGLQGRAFANDDALDQAFGTAQTVTDTLIATNDMHVTSATSAITMAGTPAANTPILFQVYRDADAAGDTFSADARLLGIEIIF